MMVETLLAKGYIFFLVHAYPSPLLSHGTDVLCSMLQSLKEVEIAKNLIGNVLLLGYIILVLHLCIRI